MFANGTLLLSARAKALLEDGGGADDLEIFPAKIRNHEGQLTQGDMYLVHVRRTCDYVDLEQSSLEWKREQIWSVYDLVAADGRLPDKPPPIFRLERARFPWLFVRKDVAEAMAAQKLKGFSSEPVGQLAYTSEKVRRMY